VLSRHKRQQISAAAHVIVGTEMPSPRRIGWYYSSTSFGDKNACTFRVERDFSQTTSPAALIEVLPPSALLGQPSGEMLKRRDQF